MRNTLKTVKLFRHIHTLCVVHVYYMTHITVVHSQFHLLPKNWKKWNQARHDPPDGVEEAVVALEADRRLVKQVRGQTMDS